jgi:hypothetical protein
MVGGGFPYQSLRSEMRDLGVTVPVPPSPDSSRIEAMRDLWASAGLDSIQTREITVRRTFADFDDYWESVRGGPSVGPRLEAMTLANIAILQTRLRARLSEDASGRISCDARANAVQGRVPK